jgi:chaperonin GroEL
MAKDLNYSSPGRAKLLAGSEKLARTVAVTMGPQGKNVIIGKFVGAPVLTKDGVSVAREIVLEDPVEDLSCQLIKEAAGRTADLAGDGTTTATVLTHEMFSRGNDLINQRYSPLHLKRGMEWALHQVVERLNDMATEVKDFNSLKNIATISANNDGDLGNIIAEAFHSVGLNGTVVAEASPGIDNTIRYVEGIEIQAGASSPAYFLDGQTEITLENCHILISLDEISNLMPIVGILNQLSDQSKPILILAKSVEKEALATLVANNKLGRLKVASVDLPRMGIGEEGHREWVDAISVMVGAKVLGTALGAPLTTLRIEDLGFANKVVVDRSKTKILEGKKDSARYQAKLDLYEDDLKKLVTENMRFDIKKRLALLCNKAAIITVGYSTELELREKGDRIEDSICATRAAIEEGYVPGGGTALLRAASQVSLDSLDSRLHQAAMVVLDSCKAPIRQISQNASEDGDEIISKVLESDSFRFGFNAATLEFGDMVDFGVIDPKKVTRTALQNAVSISLLLINTEAIVSEQQNNPSSWQPPAGWRPPETGKLSHKY